jgi:prepilin-type N-terminal cleavage/methylation domain-containing protein
MQANRNGFSLIELLIVVAVILIIAAIAIPNLLRSRVAANQASAIGSLRTINTAEVTYESTFSVGFSSTLLQLGPAAPGNSASTSAAGLLDGVLASGVKSGYNFTYAPQAPDAQGKYMEFTVNANPSQVGVTGTAHYYTDHSYVIRQNSSGVASASSSPVAN